MRSTVRLVLSSYVVVVAGCSKATSGTPSTGGYSGGVVQQGGTARAVSAKRLRLSRARVGAADTLAVRVQGPSAMKTSGEAQFTVAVENGTARRYYYWWFVASCAKGAGCAPSSYQLLADGEDRTAVSVPFGAIHVEKDIVVQVAEIDGDGQTGSSAQFVVLGPAPRKSGGRERVSGGICDWFAGSFYPHTGIYADSLTGRKWERPFRRDYCGNKISWGPPTSERATIDG